MERGVWLTSFWLIMGLKPINELQLVIDGDAQLIDKIKPERAQISQV
jgi:hypothetical protein